MKRTVIGTVFLLISVLLAGVATLPSAIITLNNSWLLNKGNFLNFVWEMEMGVFLIPAAVLFGIGVVILILEYAFSWKSAYRDEKKEEKQK